MASLKEMDILQKWFRKCEERGRDIVVMGSSVHAWIQGRTDLPWDLSVAWLDDSEDLEGFYEVMKLANSVQAGLEKWIDWSLMTRLEEISWWESSLVKLPFSSKSKKTFERIYIPNSSLWVALSLDEFSELEYSICLDVLAESFAKKEILNQDPIKEKIAEILPKAHSAKHQRLESLKSLLTD